MLITLRSIVLWQSGAVVLVALLGALFGGVFTTFAVVYGGGIAIVNLVLLHWRWRKGVGDYHCDVHRHLKGFYRSSMERFFVVGVLLGFWFGFIKTESLGMLTGFLVGQLVGMTISVVLRERT